MPTLNWLSMRPGDDVVICNSRTHRRVTAGIVKDMFIDYSGRRILIERPVDPVKDWEREFFPQWYPNNKATEIWSAYDMGVDPDPDLHLSRDYPSHYTISSQEALSLGR